MAVPAGKASGAELEPTTAGSKSPGRGARSGGAKARLASLDLRAWLLIGPAMIALAVVIGYPIVRAITMSFSKDKGLDPVTQLFVEGGNAGFSNYTHWLLQECASPSGGTAACPPGTTGSQFWAAVGVTLFFTVVTVSLEAVIGLGMAIVMGKTFKGRALLRAAVLIPWAIPTAVTSRLWEYMFAYDGVVNRVFGTHILWTSDEWPSRFAVIIADVWKTTPFMALLILAGLQMIPQDVYEAARVDGASARQRFFQITLPLVKPALMVAILFRTMDALRMYDLPAILTSGNDATQTISILVIDQLRQPNAANSASALSTITFVMIFIIAFLLVKGFGANVVRTQEDQRRGQRK